MARKRRRVTAPGHRPHQMPAEGFRADIERRRSSAGSPHVPKTRKGTRSSHRRAAIRDSY